MSLFCYRVFKMQRARLAILYILPTETYLHRDAQRMLLYTCRYYHLSSKFATRIGSNKSAHLQRLTMLAISLAIINYTVKGVGQTADACTTLRLSCLHATH